MIAITAGMELLDQAATSWVGIWVPTCPPSGLAAGLSAVRLLQRSQVASDENKRTKGGAVPLTSSPGPGGGGGGGAAAACLAPGVSDGDVGRKARTASAALRVPEAPAASNDPRSATASKLNYR